MRNAAAVSFILLSLASTAPAASNKDSRLRGRHKHRRQRKLQTEPGETRWDNNRISESNPDGLPTDEEGKLDCWPNCYADHYDGGVGNVGGDLAPIEYNRVPQTEQADTIDVGVQIALDAVQKYKEDHPDSPYHPPPNTNTAEIREDVNSNPNPNANQNPNIVYDTSTGHKYDLTTGQKIVVEEVESVSTGDVDVKVYVIEEQPGGGPLADPTPTNNVDNSPLVDPTPTTTYTSTASTTTAGTATSTTTTASAPAQCILPRNSPCSTNDSCASGCCAVLAQSTKCVDPSIAVFAQFCPKDNPCGGAAGTKVPKATGDNVKQQEITTTYVHSAVPQTGGDGGGDTSTGGDVLYTLGPEGIYAQPNPSNPNRIEGGAGGQPKPVDCTIKKDDWPMGKVPQGDDCASSCQCKTGCCVKYWAQICVDPTANNGHWADKCI